MAKLPAQQVTIHRAGTNNTVALPLVKNPLAFADEFYFLYTKALRILSITAW